jgi:nucleotide-binding universal stress UspA family protein
VLKNEDWKMFDKILVAVDDSESSQAVFARAILLAKTHQSTLMLLHVLVPTDDVYPGNPYVGTPASVIEIYLDRWQKREQDGMAMLRGLSTEAIAAGVLCEFTQNIGDPGKTICALATSWHANLVVVGRRGMTGLNEFFLGSVSNYVLHHAPCHVLTIQRELPIEIEPVAKEMAKTN